MYYETPPADGRDDEAPRWHIVEFVPLPPSPAAGAHGPRDQSDPYLAPSEPDVFAASGPELPAPPPRMRTAGNRPLFEDLDALLQASTSELEAVAAARDGSPGRRTAPPGIRGQPDGPTYAVARDLVASRRGARRRSRYARRLLRLGLFIVALVALAIVVGLGGPLLFHHPLPVRLGPFSLFAR